MTDATLDTHDNHNYNILLPYRWINRIKFKKVIIPRGNTITTKYSQTILYKGYVYVLGEERDKPMTKWRQNSKVCTMYGVFNII